jgi:D-3-phosphoglycerate dehydrogenase
MLLSGKKVGVIGLGRIGKRVAASLHFLGCDILYYDPWVSGAIPDSWIGQSSVTDLLKNADIITLHTPGQADGKPLLDKDTLSFCKKGQVIINTARGSLIDEEALLQALREERICAAGLDVTTIEPYHGPLLKCPRVIITPHVASNTRESRQQMEIEAIENMIKVFEDLVA